MFMLQYLDSVMLSVCEVLIHQDASDNHFFYALFVLIKLLKPLGWDF